MFFKPLFIRFFKNLIYEVLNNFICEGLKNFICEVHIRGWFIAPAISMYVGSPHVTVIPFPERFLLSSPSKKLYEYLFRSARTS